MLKLILHMEMTVLNEEIYSLIRILRVILKIHYFIIIIMLLTQSVIMK